MPWIASRTGAPIDLVNPVVEQVDWDDIAWSLAHSNRYGGHGETQVSEALHLLIGLDMTSEKLRPLWLIHSAYKTRRGDLMSPSVEALAQIADTLGADGGAIVKRTLAEFQERHDRVIHAAAGVARPDTGQRNMMDHIERRCRATEHRDFHRTGGPEWTDLATVQPAKTVWQFKAPDKVADLLLARFRRYLPSLRDGIL